MPDQPTLALTDLDVSIPLFTPIGNVMTHIGTVNGTHTVDSIQVGDAEPADAFGKAAAVHRERAAEQAERKRQTQQRLIDQLRSATQEPDEEHEATDEAAAPPDTMDDATAEMVTGGAAKLQVLYLPEREDAQGTHYPFALVLSGVPAAEVQHAEQLARFAGQCGAVAVLITPLRVEVD
ncbi:MULTISPECIES: hypothetical protein [Actinomadura]|uniref:Uncharacterized protein n=1 Tax=Actinomadura yumaensis TaxID=111807 RepID=A0ABW2CXI8_9ACTN|nr:hypothetical protein [Actinomadura sp. J1-007]MWK39587.1 hypothetical protein [Actinomadura sp. J1-007]